MLNKVVLLQRHNWSTIHCKVVCIGCIGLAHQDKLHDVYPHAVMILHMPSFG